MAHGHRPDGDDEGANSCASETKGLLNRRSYLKMGAAAVGTVATSSVAGEATAAAERYGVTFDTVLDAVADLGMDDTGSEPIDDALDEAYGDGTLIEFPPGEYRIEWTHFFNDGVSAFGMVGTGSSPEDVTFTFPDGDTRGQRHRDYNENQFGWSDHPYLEMLAVYSGSDHVLANFSVRQNETTGSRITAVLEDGLHIEDVHFLGFNPPIQHAPGVNIRPNITSRDGTGVVRNFVCTGGGVTGVYPERKVGVLSGKAHRGELLFDGFHVEEMGSHPIYASNTEGCIRVENGYFVSNDNTNIRVAGRHPDKRSWVKNCSIRIDIDSVDHLPDGEAYQGARAIRCDYGDDVLIEDTDIEILSGPPAAYGIGFQHNLGDSGSGARASVVRNTRIHCDADNYIPIEAQPNDGQLVLDGVSVTGNADYRYDAGIVLRQRPVDVKNSCVQLDGDGMDGIYVESVDDASISNTNINVDGTATVFNDANVSTSDITYKDSCPMPNVDDPDGGSGDGSSGDGSSGDGGSGGSDDDSSSDLDRSLTIVSAEDSLVEYTVEIDGQAEAVTSGDHPGGDYDDVSTSDGVTTIDGVTSKGRGDTWAFSGSITTFDMTGTGTVYVDGEETAPSDVATQPEEKLVVTSAEDSLVEYAFTVDGPVEPAGEGDMKGGDYDETSTADGKTTVDGVTSKGRGDTWLFGGEMTAFTMNGEGTVTVNGTVVDPAALPLGRTLRVDATNADGTVTYDVTVSGSLAPDVSAGAIEDGDNVSGSGVEGAVSGDVDAYRFSGEVTDASVSGDATLYVDGSELDTSQFGSLDHELRVVADADTVLDYTFTVDGTVEAAGSGDMKGGDWDEKSTADGKTTVTGVTSKTQGDTWKFSGDIVDMTLEAEGAVYLDGTQVDPADLGTDADAALPNRIVFDGSDSSGSTDYTFAVSGDVAKSPDLGSMEAADELADGTVTGSVDGDVDGFRFSGNLTALNLDGSADVNFE